MKKQTWVLLALLCLSCLAGCGSQDEGREGTQDQGGQSTAQTQDTWGAMLAQAQLDGSVTQTAQGSFQVRPDQVDDDGTTVASAAPGTQPQGETTSVTYGADCLFQVAAIHAATSQVTLEAASAGDVKKSTDVVVYGETQADGSLRATKVLLVRYQ